MSKLLQGDEIRTNRLKIYYFLINIPRFTCVCAFFVVTLQEIWYYAFTCTNPYKILMQIIINKMKKTVTLFLMALIAISSFAAVELQKPMLKSSKQLPQKEQSYPWLMAESAAAKVAPATLPAQKHLAKAATLDTVELYFPYFYDDPMYYPVEIGRSGDTVGGDWYFTLMNARYKFMFDIYGGTEEDMSGHYTEKDLGRTHNERMFSYVIFASEPSKSHYYKTLDLTIKQTKVSKNLTHYTLEAVVLTTRGMDEPENGIVAPETGIFKITAEHYTITPEQEIETAFLDGSITPEEDKFTWKAKNDSMEVDMLFYSETGVQGYYSHKQIDLEASTITYKNKKHTPMIMEGYISIGELTSGGVAYAGIIQVLTTDSVFFNMAFQAPIYPTDTVTFNCINLKQDDSNGMSDKTIYFEAGNQDYDIIGAYNSTTIKPGVFTGTSLAGQAMVYLQEKSTGKTIIGYHTKLDIKVRDLKEGYSIDMEVLGDDHKLYKAMLKWYIPDPVDTVKLHFEEVSKALYYIDHLGLRELQLANYNEEYSVAFHLPYIDQIMGGSFELKDLSAENSFIVKHTATEDIAVDMSKVDGKIKQTKDTTILTAKVIGLDSILYDIKMYYALPTPTETVSVVFEEDGVEFTNALPQGSFVLEAISADGSYMANVQVDRIEGQNIEQTFVMDGKFDVNDFETSNTFIKVKDPVTKKYVEVLPQKGTMTVTLGENRQLKAEASFLCDDAKIYNLTFYAYFERVRLSGDNESEELNYTYSSFAYVFFDNFTTTDSLLFMDIVEKDYSCVTGLAFYTNKFDASTGISAGVYPINNTTKLGTVNASPGIAVGGAPIQSYFSWLDAEGYYDIEGEGVYCMVDGKVTIKNVDGALRVEIDAVNSYDLPVKIVYQGRVTTDVENTPVDESQVVKRLINGELLIIRNGEVYTVTGTRVK